MYSKKMVALINCGWLAVALIGVLMWKDEVAGLRSYLTRANQRIEDLYDERFEATRLAEEALQGQRLKTHAANERHGATLERVRKAAAAKMSPEAFENFIFAFADNEVKDPVAQLHRLLDQYKWCEVLEKHYSTK